MELDHIGFEFKNEILSEIMQHFTDEQTKNIVFVEILALIFADGNYAEEEKMIIKEIKEEFGFSPDKYERYKNWVQRFNELYSEGAKLVNV